MWRDTKMVIMAALIAATYAAVMIPFKVFIIVPGFTEFRPGVVIPIVFALMFGPAAAWGAGMGNLIGDIIGGELSPGSAFGFVGNFLWAYVAYNVWGKMGILSSGKEPTMGRGWIGEYFLVAFLGSAACATFIAWGLDLLGLVPFIVLSNLILTPNLIMSGVLGPPLLAALYPRVKKWGLLYGDMTPEAKRGSRHGWAVVVLLFGGIGSAYLIGNGFYLGISEAAVRSVSLGVALAPSISIMLLAVCLLDSPWTRERRPSAIPGEAATARALATRSAVKAGGEFLKAEGLRFTYRGKDKPALDGVGFSARKGECLCVMGRSGAGKSTLCFSLRGLIPELCPGEFRGQIFLDGKSIVGTKARKLAGEIGIVFQDFESQLFCSTVELEVAFTPQNLGLPREEIGKRVRRCLELVGLRGFEKRDPATLSGGEKQRLALAAVLAGGPAVLVLDEVTSDLDPLGKREVLEVISGLYGGQQTIVATTHAYEEVSQAHSLMILDEGKAAAHGSVAEILCRPQLMREHGIRPPEINVVAERTGMSPVPPDGDPASLMGKMRGRFNASRFETIVAREEELRKDCGQPIIEVEGLTFSPEGEETILSGVDLSVREREVVAIVGRNGAGKTTLVKHFNGLLLPTAGEVRVRGTPTGNSSPFDLCRTVGFVFQNPDHQIFSESVRKELSFGPKNFALTEEEIEKRVAEALAAVRLEGSEEEDPLMLPKGGRQKVAVASILAMRPEVLVLDEPTTGLDYEETVALMELVMALNRKGHTVVMVTHCMWVVANYAQRVVVMNRGKIIADTTPRGLFADSDILESAGLIAPEIATLSNRFLGKTLLSAREIEFCLEAG